MVLRFKTPSLVLLLLTFLYVGFTAGYLFKSGLRFNNDLWLTERMILLAAFGILIPLLLGLYLISKAVLGPRYKIPDPPKSVRKKSLHHA